MPGAVDRLRPCALLPQRATPLPDGFAGHLAITPPLRGSRRDKGTARRRAGGGKGRRATDASTARRLMSPHPKPRCGGRRIRPGNRSPSNCILSLACIRRKSSRGAHWKQQDRYHSRRDLSRRHRHPHTTAPGSLSVQMARHQSFGPKKVMDDSAGASPAATSTAADMKRRQAPPRDDENERLER